MKVFNEQAVERLACANKAVRWLRNQGITPLTMELDGRVAHFQVPASAATDLREAARGYSMSRESGKVVCKTNFLGCVFTWQP